MELLSEQESRGEETSRQDRLCRSGRELFFDRTQLQPEKSIRSGTVVAPAVTFSGLLLESVVVVCVDGVQSAAPPLSGAKASDRTP